MHSFAPSLSFLFSIATLALQLAFSGLPTAHAAQLSTFNHTTSPRDNGVAVHNAHRRRHSVHAKARSTDLMLYPGRRAAGADFTYFVTGRGACGNFNVPSDFIVALNMQQFDAGDHCGAVITIIANGKTAQATIQDRCVGCGPNNLDFTEGLFGFFDPSMNGVVHGDWEYGTGPAAAPSTKAVPPTTSKAQPSSTKALSTTSAKATPSSSSVASSSSQQQTSASSASVTVAPSTTTTTPAAASPTAQATIGNLANLFEALVNVGGLMINTVPSSA